MITYGFEITETTLAGRKATCSVRGCQSREEAIQECVEISRRYGWTEPRWWQFWRWSDTRIPKLNDGNS